MTPLEIVVALQGGAPSPAVWASLEALVRERVERKVPVAQDRDDAVQNVLFKFAQKVRHGGLHITGTDDNEVRAYVDQMARNGWHDAWRKSRRAPTPDGDAVDAAFTAAAFDENLERAEAARRAAEVFQRVAEAAIERTPAAHREGRKLAWRQVEELYLEDTTVDAVVARDEGLDAGASLDDLKRAANRAMKQHQRFRELMFATAAALEQAGVLSPEDRALVERMALELKRR